MGPHKCLIGALLLISAGWCHADLPRDARLALAGRHYQEAISLLEPAAAAGNADCAYELGKLYRLGKGVDPDPDTAAYWFDAAAAAGHLPAKYLLAETYLDLDRSSEARSLMVELAAADHAGAQRWLARESAGSRAPLLAAIAADSPVRSYSSDEMSRPDKQGVTPLIFATRKGSERWVRSLLDAGVDPDHQDELGNSALHYAVSSGNEAVTGLLLKAGADPDQQTATGATPLHVTVAAGDVEMSQRLLNARADSSISDNGGWTARELAQRSDSPQLRRVFGVSTQMNSGSSRPTHRRLADAARKGDVQTLKQLIRDGADPLTLTSDGDTPLTLAIRANQPAAVASLLPHYPPAAQREALVIAARAGQPQILDWLLQQPDAAEVEGNPGDSLLTAAVSASCDECVRLLLAAGVSPAISSSSSDPLLVSAAKTGNSRTVNLLASAGADVDAQDPQQRSALWWAASTGNIEMATSLLQLGATPLTDADGVGPLHIAAAENHPETTLALVTRENVNSATGSGNTALMLAASRDAAAALAVLIQQGAEIEQRNTAGNTALILATKADAYDSASLLLKAGADESARNKNFESSRSIIESRENTRWLALLNDESKPGLLGLFN